MAERDSLRLGELFGVAQPRRTGGRGRPTVYEEPAPLVRTLEFRPQRTPGETEALARVAREQLQSAATGVPQQPAPVIMPRPQMGQQVEFQQDMAQPAPIPFQQRQEYTIDGRGTGIFFDPTQGMARQATEQERAGMVRDPRTQVGLQGSLTGAPNTMGYTVAEGPAIFSRYTPPSGGAVFGRDDRQAAMQRNVMQMAQDRAALGVSRPTVERRKSKAELEYEAALAGLASAERVAGVEGRTALEQERERQRGVQTPQQQMAEAERERQSKERIAGVGGGRQTAEQKALQKEYEERVDRQSAINTTRIQRGIQSSIQRITSAAGTVGLTEEQKQDFKRLDALQKEPTWKSFIREMTATGEFPDDPTMKSLSEQFNAALNTEEPSAYLRNIESLYDAWLKTS